MGPVFRIFCSVLVLVLGPVGTLRAQPVAKGEVPLREGSRVPVRFDRLSIEDGLSQSSVLALLQDQQGFVWIGTSNGLDRYDGYGFTHFRHDPFDSTSLGSNYILTLYEDREGFLWVGTQKGLSRFDPATETFTRYLYAPEGAGIFSHGGVTALHEDEAGRLWVGFEGGGLVQLDRETGATVRYRHDPEDPASLSHDAVLELLEDRAGALWVGTAGGLSRYDPHTDTFSRYFYRPRGEKDRGFFVSALVEDPIQDGVLWLLGRDGLYRFVPDTGALERHLPRQGRWGALAADPQEPGMLWAAVEGGGLYHLDTRTGEHRHYAHDADDPASLGSSDLTSLVVDRTGVVWAGAYAGGGVSRFDPRAGGFTHLGRADGLPDSLSQTSIFALHEDRKGRLWIGGARGRLVRLDRRTGQARQWQFGPPDPLNVLHAIHEDREGTLWVGNSEGLHRYRPEDGRFTAYSPQKEAADSVTAHRVIRIYEDRASTFWVLTAGHGGGRQQLLLYHFDRASGTFRPVDYDPDPTADHPRFLFPLYEDAAGRMWFQLEQGLAAVDAAGGVRYVLHDPADPASLSRPGIGMVHERAREPGMLWITTYGGGLDRLDTRTGEITHFTEADGLADDVTYGLLEDEDGHLWISTDNGLSRFNPETGTFTNYGVDAGLQSEEFNGGAYFRSPRTGEMFFGGMRGVNAFHPAQIQANTVAPPVVFTGFKLFNRPVSVGAGTPLQRPIAQTDTISLAYDQDVLTFEFAALHYRDPARNQYAYKLEGFDDEWVEAGTQRAATYTNLDPGAYVFRVKAANSDGVWNEEGAAVRLTILPPWWRTPWAYGLYGLLFLLGVIATDRLQRRRLVQRERAQAQDRESQLRAEAAEAWASYLQAENERKTQELEQARTLQLSMLPATLPEHPLFELAAEMRTATEVGGDYYDFDLSGDETLTFAIGDATGHGTKAGTMVTAMKSLFNLMAGEADLAQTLQRATRALRRMNLPKLYMALALGRLRGRTLELAGAGMPPALLYRAATGEVEMLPLKGMPLGGPLPFPYRKLSVELSPGDTVVLMSDGFPELRGASGEMLGYECAGEILREAGGAPPEEVIRHFTRTAEAWVNGQGQKDDMTFVVLRAKAKV